jgi:dipeptide/tripeptide permease
VGTVHGIGGVLSMVIAGQLVVHAGYDVTFLTLAAVAALGAVLFWLAMPETRGATALATPGPAVPNPAE